MLTVRNTSSSGPYVTKILNMIFALGSSNWLGKGTPHAGCVVLIFEHSYREHVAKLFEPSVEAIADAFEKQREAAAKLQIQIKVSPTLAC